MSYLSDLIGDGDGDDGGAGGHLRPHAPSYMALSFRAASDLFLSWTPSSLSKNAEEPRYLPGINIPEDIIRKSPLGFIHSAVKYLLMFLSCEWSLHIIEGGLSSKHSWRECLPWSH